VNARQKRRVLAYINAPATKEARDARRDRIANATGQPGTDQAGIGHGFRRTGAIGRFR
jgi:hypothetical protein